jgi:hypothetical protein
MPLRWITKALTEDMDIFILSYEDLKNNLDRALVNLAYFLGVALDEKSLECVMSDAEGSFHRVKGEDPYDGIRVNLTEVEAEKVKTKRLIEDCIARKRSATSGCAFARF